MIVREFYGTRNDGVNLYKTYSDEGYYIKNISTNEVSAYAIEEEGVSYIYEETNVIRVFYRRRNDGVNLYKSYSINGYLIQKVGTDEIYTEAIDVETAPYSYIETDEKLEEVKYNSLS